MKLQTLKSIKHHIIFELNGFDKKHHHLVISSLLLIILVATSWSLVRAGLGTGHDLNHQARIFEMATGLKEGVFPVIWSQNFGFGYGMPLFEFYAPLPYYFGAITYLLGANLTLAVKLMVLMANILVLVGGFFLGKLIFKNDWAATLVAAIITLAPYRAVDLHVRTAISEGWAISFIVLTLLGSALVIHRKKFGVIFLAISFAALILSHNLSALIALPLLIIFGTCYSIILDQSWQIRTKSIFAQFTAGLLGVGLAAFYIFPALLEKNFTQLNRYILDSYYDFHQHFLYIRQFFKPWGVWEYGGSGWGPYDEMSFFLGFSQLAIIFIAIIIFGWQTYKAAIDQKVSVKYWLHLLFLVVLAGYLVLTLLKTQQIWDQIAFLKYVQFPWRLLAVAIVVIGLLAGSCLMLLPKKIQPLFFLAILMVLIGINTRYFRNEKYEDHTLKYQNFSNYIREKSSENLFDYLPISMNFFQKQGFYLYKNPIYTDIEVPSRELLPPTDYQSTIITDATTKKVFSAQVASPSAMTVNLAHYPGWQAMTADEQQLPTYASLNGLITIDLPAGNHYIKLTLQDTPIRKWSKLISLTSTIIIIVYLSSQLFRQLLITKRK